MTPPATCMAGHEFEALGAAGVKNLAIFITLLVYYAVENQRTFNIQGQQCTTSLQPPISWTTRFTTLYVYELKHDS